jgi:hypothetical protein
MASMNLKEKMLLQQWWKQWKQMAHYKEGKWLLGHWWAKEKIDNLFTYTVEPLKFYKVGTGSKL